MLIANGGMGGAAAAGVMFCAYGVVRLIALGLFVAGGIRLSRDTRVSRRRGVVLLIISVALPLTCCIAPPYLIHAVSGNYPLGHYPSQVIRGGNDPGRGPGVARLAPRD